MIPFVPILHPACGFSLRIHPNISLDVECFQTLRQGQEVFSFNHSYHSLPINAIQVFFRMLHSRKRQTWEFTTTLLPNLGAVVVNNTHWMIWTYTLNTAETFAYSQPLYRWNLTWKPNRIWTAHSRALKTEKYLILLALLMALKTFSLQFYKALKTNPRQHSLNSPNAFALYDSGSERFQNYEQNSRSNWRLLIADSKHLA